MKVLFQRLSKTAKIPEYKTVGSSGMDLSADISEPVTIKPQSIGLIKTGLAIQLPQGFEAQVRSRSGLALKNGIFVLNSPGTIDNDYRGEISIILANFSQQPFTIEHGMRIAQLVIAQYQQFDVSEVNSLDETSRGDGGFGSTGVK
ncbi:MAG: dUTP pyrophosphatase [Candidatus Deianiraeaceae bacterium]|jgi:dUTP pyrophosphatase